MTKYYTTAALHWQAAVRLFVVKCSLHVMKCWQYESIVNTCSSKSQRSSRSRPAGLEGRWNYNQVISRF